VIFFKFINLRHLLFPNTGLDSKDIVGNVPEPWAVCTWTNGHLRTCTLIY